jgi:hypothetical protein
MKLITLAQALTAVCLLALPAAECAAQMGGPAHVTVALVTQLDEASAYSSIMRSKHAGSREVILLKQKDATPMGLATAMIMLGQRRRVDHGDAASAERIYLNGDPAGVTVDTMTLRLASAYLRQLFDAPHRRFADGTIGQAIEVQFR